MDELLAPFLFGISLAISVGPIALLILFNGVCHGRLIATRSALGAASGDFIYALAAFGLGGMIVSLLEQYRTALSTGSSIVLLLLGAYLCWGALKTGTPQAATQKPVGYRGTLALTLLNPLTILAFSAFIGQQLGSYSVLQIISMAAALFCGSLLMQLLFAFGGAGLQRLCNRVWFTRSLQLLSGVAIAAFGVLRIAL